VVCAVGGGIVKMSACEFDDCVSVEGARRASATWIKFMMFFCFSL